jgi:hypothetical protein
VNVVSPEEIEQALCRLMGVEAARVCWNEGTITEVHIVAAPGTRAKHIARDVRSCLAAGLGLDVDHKKISIALRKTEGPRNDAVGPSGEGATAPARDARTRLESVTLHMEASGAEAEVQLSANGRELRGEARGSPSAEGLERTVFVATLGALQQLVRHDVRLSPGEVRRLHLRDRELRLVEVTVWRPHEEQSLLGACWVRQDPYRAVAMAALSALNRTICRLTPVRWTELRVDPEETSDWPKEAP